MERRLLPDVEPHELLLPLEPQRIVDWLRPIAAIKHSPIDCRTEHIDPASAEDEVQWCRHEWSLLYSTGGLHSDQCTYHRAFSLLARRMR